LQEPQLSLYDLYVVERIVDFFTRSLDPDVDLAHCLDDFDYLHRVADDG
jgi:hypothetical protein